MSRNIQVEKVCQWCGSKFIARTTQTVYCSKRCAEHAYKDRKRKEKIERCKEEVRRVQSGSDEISEKDFLTPRQAAQFLGVCYKTFYTYINNGVIKAWKLHRKTLVRKSDLEELFSATERIVAKNAEAVLSATDVVSAGNADNQNNISLRRLLAAEIFGKLMAMEHHASPPSSLIWLWLLVTFGEPLVTFVTALSEGWSDY